MDWRWGYFKSRVGGIFGAAAVACSPSLRDGNVLVWLWAALSIACLFGLPLWLGELIRANYRANLRGKPRDAI